MKTIGVTGGMGFIGRYVIEELQNKNYIPMIFDRQKRLAKDYPENVEVFFGDCMDEIAMTEFAAHVDGIIHLAAVLGTQETISNPRPAAMSNLLGGLNFLAALKQYDLPGCYIAVGNWFMNNPYSISKNMIERFCHLQNKDLKGRINIVRAVNAYGPWQLAAAPFGPGKVRKITPALICRTLSGMPMELYGGGHQVSDMVYVADVAKILVLALESAALGNIIPEAIGAGPVEHNTIREVATLINRLAKGCGYNEVEIVDLPMRPGEQVGVDVTVETHMLQQIHFDVSDFTNLEQGMKSTIEYFIRSVGIDWEIPKVDR